ncbi:MAG: hypothetical protein NVSMB29_14050 [Candidatus Dormibacteria bacterium]
MSAAAEQAPVADSAQLPVSSAAEDGSLADAAAVPDGAPREGLAVPTAVNAELGPAPGPAPSPRHARPRNSAPPRPTNVRPRGLPHAAVPGSVPAPEHHHLPGWVRRAHAQARPVLADLLGLLEGSTRAKFADQVKALNDSISAGKFSLAWQYPQLIAEGASRFEAQRKEHTERTAEQRALEAARRRAADQLRDAGSLAPDVTARLNRSLRSAPDPDAMRSVEAEIREAASSSRTTQEKRRDRQIEKTRDRLRKSLPRAANVEAPSETWQDVLRRFAAEQQPDAD